jgi:hypothetical protein
MPGPYNIKNVYVLFGVRLKLSCILRPGAKDFENLKF